MSDIRLDDGTIKVDGEWLSAEALAERIQKKMEAGDMKLTAFAAALEQLNLALENSHTLEVRLFITRAEYEKLKALGGDDDRESVRRAIAAAIGGGDASGGDGDEAAAEAPEPAGGDAAPAAAEKIFIHCPHPQCMTPIEIASTDRPLMVSCPTCGLSGQLTADNQWVRPPAKG